MNGPGGNLEGAKEEGNKCQPLESGRRALPGPCERPPGVPERKIPSTPAAGLCEGAISQRW